MCRHSVNSRPLGLIEERSPNSAIFAQTYRKSVISCLMSAACLWRGVRFHHWHNQRPSNCHIRFVGKFHSHKYYQRVRRRTSHCRASSLAVRNQQTYLAVLLVVLEDPVGVCGFVILVNINKIDLTLLEDLKQLENINDTAVNDVSFGAG